MSSLASILKDSNFKLTQFNTEKIRFLEDNITKKEVRGKNVPYFKCQVRKKEVKLTPEEIIRQRKKTS